MENQQIESFDRTIAASSQRLGLTGRWVLAAVSGGPDSVALMFSLTRAGVRLEVASVDHGLRATGAAEVELVRAHSARLGLAFHGLKVSVRAGAGLEAAARDARYSALEKVRSEQGLDVVATGHTASDQAETVLMRLGRGAALGGAAGILERRADHVVRPLLGVTRAQTHAYVEAMGLEVARDPMNEDRAFTRVRVRHEVLPSLVAATGPGTERALSRFAQLAHEDDELLSGLANTALARAVLADGSLDRVALLSFERPVRRRVLASFLELATVPLDAELIDECLASIERRGTATLPLELLLVVRDETVGVVPAPARTPSFGLGSHNFKLN